LKTEFRKVGKSGRVKGQVSENGEGRGISRFFRRFDESEDVSLMTKFRFL